MRLARRKNIGRMSVKNVSKDIPVLHKRFEAISEAAETKVPVVHRSISIFMTCLVLAGL